MTKLTAYSNSINKFIAGVLSIISFTILLMFSYGCTATQSSPAAETSPTMFLNAQDSTAIPSHDMVFSPSTTPAPYLIQPFNMPDLNPTGPPMDQTSPETTGCPIPPHVQIEYKGAPSNPIFSWSSDNKEIGLTAQFRYQQSAVFYFAVAELLETRKPFIPVAPSPRVNEYDFSWSPDSNAFAFISQHEAGLGNMAYQATDIYLINVEDKTRTLLVSGERYLPNTAPSWSFDGRTIAFISGQYGRLYIIPANGGETIQISSIFARHHVWSPDSSKLAYTGFIPMGSPPSFSNSNLYIFTIDVNDYNEQNLTTDSFCSLVPDWSPDGGKILFESYRNNQWDLYLMEQDGTELVNLTNDPRYDYDGDWSPNGQQIVFASYNHLPEIDDPILAGGSNQELFLVSADGKEISQLTNTPNQFELSPSWSPDGQYIAFLSYDTDDGNWHLDLIRLEDSGRFRLFTFPN